MYIISRDRGIMLCNKISCIYDLQAQEYTVF